MKTTTSEAKTAKMTCPKCLGGGTVPFKHIENGRCFMCMGSGKIDVRTNVKAPKIRKRTEEERRANERHTLRCWYANAKGEYQLTYEDLTVPNHYGEYDVTPEYFEKMLDENPGSREAFRALGWPV